MPSGRTVQQKRQASIREVGGVEGKFVERWAAWCWEESLRLPCLGKASLVRLPLRRLSLLSTLSSFLSSPTSDCPHRPRRRLPSCLSLFFIVWPIRIPSFLWDPLHSFGCTSLTFTFTIRFRHSLLRPAQLFRIFTQQTSINIPFFFLPDTAKHLYHTFINF
jgi:hypothetical protein